MRYITPLNLNKIRQNLLKTSALEIRNEVFNSVSRMAFEKDPALQIVVVQLDYNSLECFKGPITFVDGLSKISFRGRALTI